MGRKLCCLFVYYVEQIDNKQWMAKEAATFNGGVESRLVHDNIRRKIQEQCEAGLSIFLDPFLEEYGWSLLRFLVVVFLKFMLRQ
jgi:hypothetical protein